MAPTVFWGNHVAWGTASVFSSCGAFPTRDHRRARRRARRQGGPDFRPEAPELCEGLLPSHPRQVRENHECLEPEYLLHRAQGVARLLRRAHDPGPAGHTLLKCEGWAARQRWGAADDVGPEQLRELVVARPRGANRCPRRGGQVEIDLEQAVFTRSEPDAVGLLGHGAVPAPPGDQPLPGVVGEHTAGALPGGAG